MEHLIYSMKATITRKKAKKLGDYLIVGVTTEHFDEARGKVNVVDSIIERIDNVRKTGFVDMIIVED